MMPFPQSRLTDVTLTMDVITGPGAPTILVGGMPASAMGDAVAGAACAGAVMVGSPTVLVMNRPAARVTSNCTGVVPAIGSPVSTAVATGCPTVLIP